MDNKNINQWTHIYINIRIIKQTKLWINELMNNRQDELITDCMNKWLNYKINK